MTVFVCGGEPEDIWCAVYDAWMSRLGHENVRIEPFGGCRALFCEYREVAVRAEKAGKVTDSIRRKLGERVYEEIWKAALSREKFRADHIYRFLIRAFAVGSGILNRLELPEVFRVFQMNRNLLREYDHSLGFLRFSERENGLLAAEMAPENDLVSLLAIHFADRMPQENWLIYDRNREKGALHRAGAGWMLARFSRNAFPGGEKARGEAELEALWRTFYTSVAIRERKNPRCQNNLLPLRFRPYMTEFAGTPFSAF